MSEALSIYHELTDRQWEILDVFFNHLLEHGSQPGLRDLAAALGTANHNVVKCHIAALIKKGWLAPPANKGDARSMRILRQPDGTPFAGLRFITTPTLERPLP